MRASDIIRHAAAFAGDTTGRSKMERDFLIDYVGFAIEEIINRMSRHTKDWPFLYTLETLDLSVLGTSGDYEMPADFYKEFDVAALGVTGTKIVLDGVPMDRFLSRERQYIDRPSYTTYWNIPTKRWRMRFYMPGTSAISDVSSFEVSYRRKQPTLQSPSDELIFPDGQGWEQVIIYGAMKHAYRFMQENMSFDPMPEFERLLADQIAAKNAEVPDQQFVAPVSENILFFKRMEGEP